MEVWNGIWKKILVRNGIWNGRFLVWNGRKFPVWNMEKSSSIPYHALSVTSLLTHSISVRLYGDSTKHLYYIILHTVIWMLNLSCDSTFLHEALQWCS